MKNRTLSGLFFLGIAFGGLFTLAPTKGLAVDIQTVTSEGGITAWLVEEHRLPIIDFTFAVRRGIRHEPAGKEGIASLMTYLLDEGAEDLDDREFVAELEAIAANLQFDPRGLSISGSLRTLSENQESAFALLKKAINSPRFDEAPFERVRQQLVSKIKREKQDPADRVGHLLFARAFEGNPIAKPSSGTLESLAGLTPADLKAFHKAAFTREGLVVVVVGDMTAEALKPLLDELFGDLPATTSLEEVPKPEFKHLGKTDVETLDVPQSEVRWLMPGPRRDEADFFPAFVLNHILGGSSFNSRFFFEVRDKRGLAYSVGTSLVPLRDIGLFYGSAGVANDKVAETLEVMRETRVRLAEEGPTEAEVELAKRYLMGSFGLGFDTSAKIANRLLGQQLVGLPIDYLETRNDRVAKVTREAVAKAAKRYLVQPIFTAVVGKPENIEDDFSEAVE